VGGAGAQFLDPVNLATIPFSGSGSLVKIALTEAALNVAVEVVSHPFINSWQKELGNEYGLADLGTNAAFAAFFGGTIGTLPSAVSRSVRFSKSFALKQFGETLETLNQHRSATAAQMESIRLYNLESKADNISPELHDKYLREADLALIERREPNFAQFGEDVDAKFKEANMPRPLQTTHARFVDESPIVNNIDPHSPANLTRKATLEDLDNVTDAVPDLENVKQVSDLYETPEWKAREKKEFQELLDSKRLDDDAVLIRDGEKDEVTFAKLSCNVNGYCRFAAPCPTI